MRIPVAGMLPVNLPAWRENREASGFLLSLAFVCLASARDVYLGGLFQRFSPLHIAIVAFTLCSLIFLPIACAQQPESLRALLHRPLDLFWVNATSAIAWIAFFYALRTMEPSLVQVLFSGIGPLTVTWLDRLVPGVTRPAPFRRMERPFHLGLLSSLIVTVAVTVGGWSGAGALPLGVAALGVALALGAGISISVNTVLCKKLNENGVHPVALVALRFLGAIILAAVLSRSSADILVALSPVSALALVVAAALLLIVFPIYVNQVGISLASPRTVRVVLSLGPVLIFSLQIVEGRLVSSPYSLACAGLYSFFAIGAVVTRQRAIRSAAGTDVGGRC